MPVLGTLKINVQQHLAEGFVFGVVCPFYKVGMPVGMSCSDPHVVFSIVAPVPVTGTKPSNGIITFSVDTTSELITFPATLVLTVGV
jgi:hypothetical protein